MALRDDANLLILTSLAGGPKHGYAMIEDIWSITGVRLGPGTLYTAIKRLRASKLISETDADADRRRCYKLTRKGRTVAEEEARRLNDLVRVARKRGLLTSAS